MSEKKYCTFEINCQSKLQGFLRLAFILIASYGYVLNIYKLATSPDGITALDLVRIVAIPIFPLGWFLGFM
jgi:hypothetical protein